MRQSNDENPSPWEEATTQMLSRAYPDGLLTSDYLGVLKALLEYASQRNVADVVSGFADMDRGVVYNDVLAVDGGYNIVPESDFERVMLRLKLGGYDDWVRDQD